MLLYLPLCFNKFEAFETNFHWYLSLLIIKSEIIKIKVGIDWKYNKLILFTYIYKLYMYTRRRIILFHINMEILLKKDNIDKRRNFKIESQYIISVSEEKYEQDSAK